MNKDQRRRIDELFHSALARDPAERETWLAAACEGDDELRRNVEDLLKNVGGGDAMLGQPGWSPRETLDDSQPSPAVALNTQLGHYRIMERVGAGGMGVVYKATDTKLDRLVALKVVRPELLNDEGLRRLEREARALASLNHPRVAAIHGLEEAGGARFLVLEYVPGPTLAERLRRGPLPIREAMLVTKQIAEALEAAHATGVIHRDLKPANIKVSEDGQVKVLDFGLAKSVQRPHAVPADSILTMTGPLTREMTVVGTAAYMSPEQACGKTLDSRTDIWSFGCVLYEVLTANRAFGGETVTEILAAVIEREPDWQALPSVTPVTVLALLRRCLRKDPQSRLRDIGDARIELEEALAGPLLGAPNAAGITRRTALSGDDAAVAAAEGEKTTGEVRARSRLFLFALVFGVAGLIVGAAAMFVFRRPVSHQPQQVLRTALPLAGEPLAFGLRPIAMSPDGSRVAYVVSRTGYRRLFLRVLDSAAVTSVPESDGAEAPFFSPDSRWLGFWADGKLKKALVSDLSVVPICDTPGTAGASWGANGTIVFSSGRKLYRVPEAGGTPQLVAAPDPEARESALYLPDILPAGDVVLATRDRLPNLSDVVAVPLNGGRLKQVLPAAAGARYAPTGHLVYYRPTGRSPYLALSDEGVGVGRLMAAPFDPIRVEVTGASVMMAEVVRGVKFDFSAPGTLLYAAGTRARFMLVWVDRTGAARQVGPVENYNQPALSPDGRRIAVSIGEDSWVYDLERETLTQVTFNGALWPIWTPDGTRLTYVTLRNDALNVAWKNANGTGKEEQLTTSPHAQSASSWSSDGKLLVFQEFHPKTKGDIWLLDVGQGRKLRCFLCTDAYEGSPAFSPDGRWIAYISSVSGPMEVYVRPVDGSEKKYPISNGTGSQPLWSRDGKELFYWKDQQIGSDPASMQMMAVDVTLGPVFRAGKPRPIFAGTFRSGGRANFDITADGKRFLMVQPVQWAAITELQLVVNWFEELRARVRPTGR